MTSDTARTRGSRFTTYANPLGVAIAEMKKANALNLWWSRISSTTATAAAPKPTIPAVMRMGRPDEVAPRYVVFVLTFSSRSALYRNAHRDKNQVTS